MTPARTQRRSRKPGYRWRWLAYRDADGRERAGGPVSGQYDGTEGVCFDELVVDDWLHIEQMDTRQWWMDIAGIRINVWVRADGKPEVMIEDDDPERHTLRSYL